MRAKRSTIERADRRGGSEIASPWLQMQDEQTKQIMKSFSEICFRLERAKEEHDQLFG